MNKYDISNEYKTKFVNAAKNSEKYNNRTISEDELAQLGVSLFTKQVIGRFRNSAVKNVNDLSDILVKMKIANDVTEATDMLENLTSNETHLHTGPSEMYWTQISKTENNDKKYRIERVKSAMHYVMNDGV